ncbi:MAG: hypothetical protein Tp1111DCM843611_19 [Prokaryotic dsDNA virus sp.]|nr:MAG: hypothetical protein Tp1111DCM843611_19 [Prokaryotic dsDNA virus sp.]|tara:strand:+ start:11654 stop:12187 length:534 start_codon:yes stop_codon:yes gene_type:complete
MKTKNIERYLESFGKQVVNRAKGNLQRQKGGKTNLEKTLRFEVITDDKGFVVNFYMANYGSFVDKGVSGTNKKQSYKDYKGTVVKSPYEYTTKQPPAGILAKWISKKRIKGRDKKTGRFISNLSLAFIFAKKIKRDGIKGISFFQKPLGLGIKQFGKDLLKNVKQDIVDSLSTITVN